MRQLVTLVVVFSACGPLPVPVVLPPDAGAPVPSLRETVASAELRAVVKPRVSGAGLRVQRSGDRVITLTVSRDELGQVSRRLVATAGTAEVWSLEEALDERFNDFALHPSGEVTLGLEHRAASADAFELLRLSRDGQVLYRQVLARPTTIPASDLPSPFKMKGVPDGSVVTGWLPWLQLEAHGEDLVVGVVSFIDTSGAALVSGVISLGWNGAFTERWARIVDGPHSMIAVAWQYDEFLWLDAATRLLVNVSEDGSVVVGRTLSNGRCSSLADTFHEITQAQCRRIRSVNSPHRYQPFAFTSFSADGARLGTAVLAPAGLEEFVIFDMDVRGKQVAVAGTAVRLGPNDSAEYYFEPPGATSSTPLSPYDGYLAVVDPDGAVHDERFVDLGRGDYFAALRWTDEGLLAAGASDWNRWFGGMSLSRGAQPLLVLAPLDGSPVLQRTLAVAARDRHTHLLDVGVRGNEVIAVGPADAPMTHSGDAELAPMAMGSVQVTLNSP
jgi:hypothetical protein